MIWGGGTAVPLFGPLGLVALGAAFLAGGIVLRSRAGTRWLATLSLLMLIAGPLVALVYDWVKYDISTTGFRSLGHTLVGYCEGLGVGSHTIRPYTQNVPGIPMSLTCRTG